MRQLMAAALAMLIVAGSVCVGSAARQDGDDLPAGDGKKILLASCTACHDLKEVTKFRGYYTKAEWRDIVTTMIEYGATVDAKDVDVLVDYLAKTLGKPEQPAR
jgi:hypothetical protein